MNEQPNEQSARELALKAVYIVKTGDGLIDGKLPEEFRTEEFSEPLMIFIDMVSQDYVLAKAAEIRELDLGSFQNNRLLLHAISHSTGHPFMNEEA